MDRPGHCVQPQTRLADAWAAEALKLGELSHHGTALYTWQPSPSPSDRAPFVGVPLMPRSPRRISHSARLPPWLGVPT